MKRPDEEGKWKRLFDQLFKGGWGFLLLTSSCLSPPAGSASSPRKRGEGDRSVLFEYCQRPSRRSTRRSGCPPLGCCREPAKPHARRVRFRRGLPRFRSALRPPPPPPHH